MPAVAVPPAPAGNRDVVINAQTQSSGEASTLRNLTLNSNAGSHAIPAGTYGAFTVNGSSELVLGVPGATEPAVYNFQRLTVNSSGTGGVKILGPVTVTLAKGTSLQSAAGAPDHPEWLVLRIATEGLTLNTGASFHGSVIAPNGTVTLNNATLRGTVVSDRLVLNGTGLLVDPSL
jgi:rhamnogalacturonan endolyase